MIARAIHDTVLAFSGASWTNPVQVTLKQQQRRLEAIFIEANFPDSVTLSGAAAGQEVMMNVVKNVQFQVSDAIGTRDLVNASGSALIDEWIGMGGSQPLCNQVAIGNQQTVAQTNRRVIYPVFIRHPQLEEPAGNLTSLPLYELRDNPVLTITPGAASDIATGFAVGANFRLRVIWVLRDVNSGEYIPSEVKSSNFDSLSASSTVDLEVPSTGLLTSVLLQGYTTSAKTIRRDLCSAVDHSVKLWYGRELIRNVPQTFGSDYQAFTNPSTGVVAAGGSAFSLSDLGSRVFFDLSDDLPLIGAFNLNSGLNLSSIRASGDTARVQIDQTNSSGLSVRMTTRKLLGGPLGKVQGA